MLGGDDGRTSGRLCRTHLPRRAGNGEPSLATLVTKFKVPPTPHYPRSGEGTQLPLMCRCESAATNSGASTSEAVSRHSLPRNWMILRRSRFDGLLPGDASKGRIAFRSSANFWRNS